MTLLPPNLPTKVATDLSGEDLKTGLDAYFARLNDNPFPDGHVPGGTALGLQMFLGLRSGELYKMRNLPEFMPCINRLRERMNNHALQKDFVKQITNRTYLDLTLDKSTLSGQV